MKSLAPHHTGRAWPREAETALIPQLTHPTPRVLGAQGVRDPLVLRPRTGGEGTHSNARRPGSLNPGCQKGRASWQVLGSSSLSGCGLRSHNRKRRNRIWDVVGLGSSRAVRAEPRCTATHFSQAQTLQDSEDTVPRSSQWLLALCPLCNGAKGWVSGSRSVATQSRS